MAPKTSSKPGPAAFFQTKPFFESLNEQKYLSDSMNVVGSVLRLIEGFKAKYKIMASS